MIQLIKAIIQGRSTKWPKVRKLHLRNEPECQFCGGKMKLEVHHIIPFHANKSLELCESNLITLCEKNKCHLKVGHLNNWKLFNKNVRGDVEIHKKATGRINRNS